MFNRNTTITHFVKHFYFRHFKIKTNKFQWIAKKSLLESYNIRIIGIHLKANTLKYSSLVHIKQNTPNNYQIL